MRRVWLAAAVALWAAPLAAHEFWIDPLAWQVPANGQIEAHIRVGQDFRGAEYAYVPPNFRRFDLAFDGELTEVSGRVGDRPALNMAAPAEGLATVIHVTRDYILTYSEWQKFINFAEEKDFTWALEEHAVRDLPTDRFKERYARYGKSLIAVGSGEGADLNAGLEVEIVALANPYTDDLSKGFPVAVYYQGDTLTEAQLTLFEMDPDGAVTSIKYLTDDAGQVLLPVKAGHSYLADHVVLRPLDPIQDGDPVWESLWASLTFKVP